VPISTARNKVFLNRLFTQSLPKTFRRRLAREIKRLQSSSLVSVSSLATYLDTRLHRQSSSDCQKSEAIIEKVYGKGLAEFHSQQFYNILIASKACRAL